MHNIDKEKFGKFVSQLRKEKGLTQKELAEKLFISDKAISKWERGLSMPDISLLTPLAEELGVSVAELLNCQPMERENLPAEQVDELLQKAINLNEEKPKNSLLKWICLPLSTAVCLLELYVLLSMGHSPEILLNELGALVALGWGFGLYFWFFALEKLPSYYDQNNIGYYVHGAVRMNLPGVSFNNSNWPHVLRNIRLWTFLEPMAVPLLYIILDKTGLLGLRLYILLALILGSLFIPLYYAAKKYQ